MQRSLILIGLFLVGILLISCTSQGVNGGLSYELENPLTAEDVADHMIEYVTELRIQEQETGEKITDPAVLRAIDDVLVKYVKVREAAHDAQDAGKMGMIQPRGSNTAFGEVLLLDETLYTSYDFELSMAPDVEVYLAKHVGPATSDELFSEATLSLGGLKSYRGAQRYAVASLSVKDWNEYRTVVFYSKPMKKIIGFSQIRGKVR